MPIATDTRIARLLRILEATVLVVATLYFGRPVLLPVFAAVLLTFLLAPPITWLQRHAVPRLAAVLTLVIGLFSVLGLIAWNASVQLTELALRLPTYEQNLRAKIEDFRGSESGLLRRVGESLSNLKADITESAKDPQQPDDRAKPSESPAPLLVKVAADPMAPLETARLAITSMADLLASIGVVTVLVIFMSMSREDLRDRVLRLAGTSQLTLTTLTLTELSTRISSYLLLNALINGGFGLTIGVGLYLIGVEYAALWGMLAAVLRFIPYVGVMIAAALPIGLAIAQFSNWTQPAIVMALFVAVELLISNAIEPLIYGRRAGVAPVALLLAALFWGWLWGLPGLVLSVPLTVSLAVLGKYLPPLEPLWILLGNEASLSTSARYYQRLLAGDADEASDVIDEHRLEHGLLETFDNVLLPALAQAERDRQRGDITQAQQDLIWSTTDEILEELPDEAAPATDIDRQPMTPLAVVAIPVQSRADELALKMLSRLAPEGVKIESMATAMLTGELLTGLQLNLPDLICISALGPIGAGQIRYICKRVRQSFSALPIVVCRWAYQGDSKRMSESMLQRGATSVFTQIEPALKALSMLRSQRVGMSSTAAQ
jgi:predicted PurR-regulated permease PerM